MSGTKRLFRRFLSLASAKVVTTIIAILSAPIIVRLLGSGGYGDYAVLLSIYSLYMIPISSAITEGVQKFVAEEREHEDWAERVIQFYLVFAFALVSLGALALLSFTRLGFAERLFGDEFAFYFYVLVVFVFVGQFRALSMHTVLGFGLEHVQGPLGVLRKLVTVVLGIVLVVFGFGVFGMLVGNIVANVIVALIAGFVIARRITLARLFEIPDSVPIREFLSFNGLNVLLVFLVMSLFHVDVVMVRTLVSSDATGYYKAALALAEYIWIVPIVLQRLLLHSTSSLWSEGRTDQITDLAGRVTRYTTLLVILMAVGLASLAHRFVPIYYGSDFSVATTPLLLLLPGAIGFAVARPLQAICQGSGELRTLIMAIATAAILNLVLNGVLIPIYGMNGAAVATSISYGSMFLLLVWASWQIGYDPLSDFRPGRIAATVGLSAVPIYGLGRLFGSDILTFLVVPVIGLAVFVLCAVLTGAVDIAEIRELQGKLPAPFNFGTVSSES